MIKYYQSLFALKRRIIVLDDELKDMDKVLSDPGTSKRTLKKYNFCRKYKRKHLQNQVWKYDLYISQRGKCCFCSKRMFADAEKFNCKSDIATIEHVVPKSQGGGNDISNYKLSCANCNNKRGTMNFDRFKVLMSSDKNFRKTRSVEYCQEKKIKENNRLQEKKKLNAFGWALHILYNDYEGGVVMS